MRIVVSDRLVVSYPLGSQGSPGSPGISQSLPHLALTSRSLPLLCVAGCLYIMSCLCLLVSFQHGVSPSCLTDALALEYCLPGCPSRACV